MNIAYFTHLYSNPKSGPGRFAEYVRRFYSDKINFTFFSDAISPAFAKNEVKVHSIPLICKFPGYWLIRSYLFYLSFLKRSTHFNLIVCSNAFEAFIMVLFIRKIPVVVMINDDNYIFTRSNFLKNYRINNLRKTLSRYFGYSIEKAVVRKATRLIACSEYLKDAIIKSYRIEKTKVTVIYPAVDLDHFVPKKRNYFRNKQINLLFVKNDWRRGGLDKVIAGLSKISKQQNVFLNIVGPEAKDENEIRSIGRKYGVIEKLKFFQVLSKEELLVQLHEADALILLSRQEAFGVSILEALATATPVIASDVGGIPEVLKNGMVGFMVHEGEYPSILNRLIEYPEEVLPKIEFGINHAKEFSKNNLYSRLEDFILSLSKEQK